LPFLGKREVTGTQIGTQNLFRKGHDVSSKGTTVPGIPLLDLSGSEQLGQEKGSLDKTGQSAEMVRGTGFEPVTFRV
jgi:hypothetical protein